jgi:hypothetical protein
MEERTYSTRSNTTVKRIWKTKTRNKTTASNTTVKRIWKTRSKTTAPSIPVWSSKQYYSEKPKGYGRPVPEAKLNEKDMEDQYQTEAKLQHPVFPCGPDMEDQYQTEAKLQHPVFPCGPPPQY